MVPQCALETKAGHLYVLQRYLKLFFPPDKGRLEARMIPGGGWAYFNRRGLIIVQNIASFDNGASAFHHGLVRIVSEGKWGLANSRGALIVPLKYDGMLEYDESSKGWKACTGCREISDGEYHWFEGENWYWLNQRGELAGRAEDLPKPPQESLKN
jgi:hypothetical protein